MKMKKIAAAIAIMSLSCGAQANLLTNGDFETGNLSGWSTFGADLSEVNSGVNHDGLYGWHGYDNSGFGSLSQSFATTIGATYAFSFYYSTYEASIGNQMSYSFTGSSANFVVPTSGFSWQQVSGTFVATAVSTNMEFLFATDPGTGTWRLDGVDVVLRAAPVPEPETYAMLLAGLGLLGFSARRRKQKHAA